MTGLANPCASVQVCNATWLAIAAVWRFNVSTMKDDGAGAIRASGSDEPVVARCPSCGHSLSEAAVVANAPVCSYCNSVITRVRGSLGLTGAFGVSDSTLTLARLNADLAVLNDYQHKYTGMLADCSERLKWGREKYAKLPPRPDLLPTQTVPSIWPTIRTFFAVLVGGVVGGLIVLMLIGCLGGLIAEIVIPGTPRHADQVWGGIINGIVPLYFLALLFVLVGVLVHGGVVRYRAISANGARPSENARREANHRRECDEALKAAELEKDKQDHRLRLQIREAEANLMTVREKAGSLREQLSNFRSGKTRF
jgi:hypothetical protein